MNTKFVMITLILLLTVFNYLTYPQALFEYKEVKTLTLYAPAVTSGGQGIISKITLAIAAPGWGRVFLSALPYTEIETQGAARVAAYIASLIANKDFSQFDYYILMESIAPIVGGPSAGGLMTVGLISLLLDIPVYSNVTMTGMVNPDGTIGPVGGLIEKIQAASSNGFKIFLIPAGQRIYQYPIYEETRIGRFVIRRVRYEQVDLVELGRQLNVSVYEVFSVLEALYYFTGVNLNSSIKVAEHSLSSIESRLRLYIDDLIDKTISNIAYSTSLVQRIINPYYKYQYLSQLSQLNNSLNTLVSIKDDYPAYAAVSILDLYKSSIIYKWSLQIGLNEISINDLVKYVNESIVNLYDDVNSNTCTLRNSFTQFLMQLAWRQYLNAMSVSDTSTMVQYLGEAVRLIEQTRLHSLFQSSVELDCSHDIYLELYSHNYAIYAYVSEILGDLGAGFESDIDLDSYLDIFNLLYTEGNVGTYVGFIYLYTYSTLSLHRALNTLNNLVENRDRVLSIYYVNAHDEVLLFYMKLLSESLHQRDSKQASLALITIIGVLHVFRINKISGSSYITNSTATSTTSQSQVQSTGTNETVLTMPVSEKGIEYFKKNVEIILLLILVILILLLFIRIVYAFKPTK